MATPHWYTTTVFTTLNGTGVVDIDTGTFKFLLLTSSYTPAQDTHNFRDDITAVEASGGSGYPAGGFTLSVSALAQSTNTINWDTADISQAITGGPLAFRYGAIAKILGGASVGRSAARLRRLRRPVDHRRHAQHHDDQPAHGGVLMTDIEKLKAAAEKADEKASQAVRRVPGEGRPAGHQEVGRPEGALRPPHRGGQRGGCRDAEGLHGRPRAPGPHGSSRWQCGRRHARAAGRPDPGAGRRGRTRTRWLRPTHRSAAT